jgi:hypothetical protein
VASGLVLPDDVAHRGGDPIVLADDFAVDALDGIVIAAGPSAGPPRRQSSHKTPILF